MIDQQTAEMILSVASSLENVACQYRAAGYAMRQNNNIGLAAFLKNEESERMRCMRGMVDYVLLHRGKISQILPRAPVAVTDTTASQCLSILVKQDEGILSQLQGACNQLTSNKQLPAAVYVSSVAEKIQYECNEVRGVMDNMGENVYPGMIAIDLAMRKKYAEHVS